MGFSTNARETRLQSEVFKFPLKCCCLSQVTGLVFTNITVGEGACSNQARSIARWIRTSCSCFCLLFRDYFKAKVDDKKKICKAGGVLGYNYKVTRRHDDRERGKFMQVTLNKKYDSTVLAVSWRTTTRVIGANRAARWYITIDGRECSSPDKIAMTMYKGNNANLHVPSFLTGYCKRTGSGAIRKGKHVIAAHIGKERDYSVGDTLTGWSSPSLLRVKEICPPFWFSNTHNAPHSLDYNIMMVVSLYINLSRKQQGFPLCFIDYTVLRNVLQFYILWPLRSVLVFITVLLPALSSKISSTEHQSLANIHLPAPTGNFFSLESFFPCHLLQCISKLISIRISCGQSPAGHNSYVP